LNSDYAQQERVPFCIASGTALLLRMTGNCAFLQSVFCVALPQ
jgi:hypothetical protein